MTTASTRTRVGLFVALAAVAFAAAFGIGSLQPTLDAPAPMEPMEGDHVEHP